MSINTMFYFGILVGKFQEFLERIFEAKKKSELEELIDLDTELKNKYDVTIVEIIEEEFENMILRIQKVEVYQLDLMVLLVYSCVNSKNKSEYLEKLRRIDTLNKRLLDLIYFIEEKTNKPSMERNNLKNSLKHQQKQ